MYGAAYAGSTGGLDKWKMMQERKISWRDLWRDEPMRINFTLRSVYDLLPTLANLAHWSDEKSDLCPLCKRYGSLQQILNSCPDALSKYKWRHDQVLTVMNTAGKEAVAWANKEKRPAVRHIAFVPACVQPTFQ